MGKAGAVEPGEEGARCRHVVANRMDWLVIGRLLLLALAGLIAIWVFG